MLVLSRADVEAVLDRRRLIDAVSDGLAQLSAGQVSAPPRIAANVADVGGLLAAMPGYLPTAGPEAAGGVLGAKLVGVFPANAGRGVPTHQAVVLLFDAATGTPEAMLDGTALTAERTAAASAVATRLLARPDSAVLAVLGTGVQALSHLRTVPLVCPGLRQVVIAGRNPDRARALVDTLGGDFSPLGPLGRLEPAQLTVSVRAASTVSDAVAEADIVCATTDSSEPVVHRADLRPGTHVNSVGFHANGREIDAATVVDASVWVESRAAALAPFPAGANDLLWPIRDGLISDGGADSRFGEIGELLLGLRPGRATADELTLYKSVGVAVEDLVAASLVLSEARRLGLGTNVDL